MPEIILGQVKPTIPIVDNLESNSITSALSANMGNQLNNLIFDMQNYGLNLYTHTYNEDTKTHNFKGLGKCGYCKITHDYSLDNGDIITLNSNSLETINNFNWLKQNNWIIFVIEDNKMLLFDWLNIQEIPDGKLITTVNDMNIWFACAGLNYAAMGSPTDDIILTNRELLTDLFSSENAREYFQRSSTLISKYVSNGIVNEILDAQNPFISPLLTSNTSPEGYSVYANNMRSASNWPAYGAWGDYTIVNPWLGSSNSTTGHYVALYLPVAIWPYKVKGAWGMYNDSGDWYWRLDGSNDSGQTWDVISEAKPYYHLSLTNYTRADLNYKPHTAYNLNGATKKYNAFRLVNTSKGGTYYAQMQGCQVYGFV